MLKEYNHKKIEKKWQKKWDEAGIFKASLKPKNKYYSLETFPYPSAAGLHVGHPEGYTAEDINARYQRMNGKDVLYTMGWDAFGLPTENYAIKIGRNPKEVADNNIKNFKRQVKVFGFSYDWSREINTSDPAYYKWTQWFFLLMYKHGLACKGKAPVNWCESCKTVLANEQVMDGKCERCENVVLLREMEQWFFKITEFADELLSGLEKLDWPDSTKEGQRNWIGKSEGAALEFPIVCHPETIDAFTTRPDTLFGATYLVLAPEHELIQKLEARIKNHNEVQRYIESVQKKSQFERAELQREKTGVELKGIKAINPATKEEIPIWLADYVLASYGTGAIMAVPAHDERDFDFAKKYKLEIREVIKPPKGVEEDCYLGGGILVNSGKFNGMDSEKAKIAITKAVGGKLTSTCRLRGWLISRQRYWGAPIPIVYDPKGKPHPVKEEHLPWLLPKDVDFKPTGKSPLASSKEFIKRTEKLYGKGFRPEFDTMDTFVDSSWYFFRYTDPNNEKEFANKKKIHLWMPVDLYIIGAEHTVLHLLYARFFTKVLKKFGYIDFDEPFFKLRHIGLILGEDHRKMSKRWGNVVNPDDVVGRFGADAVRMYEMFMGPLRDEKPWDTQGIKGISRFLQKIWHLRDKVSGDKMNEESKRLLHQTIKKVTEDIEALKYNTAIAQMMILVNAFSIDSAIPRKDWEMFLAIFCPFAPHISEELWEILGNRPFLSQKKWPKWDENFAREETITIVIQVNGKVRAEQKHTPGISKENLEKAALEDKNIQKWTSGKKIKKVIVVPDKLVNVVVG